MNFHLSIDHPFNMNVSKWENAHLVCAMVPHCLMKTILLIIQINKMSCNSLFLSRERVYASAEQNKPSAYSSDWCFILHIGMQVRDSESHSQSAPARALMSLASLVRNMRQRGARQLTSQCTPFICCRGQWEGESKIRTCSPVQETIVKCLRFQIFGETWARGNDDTVAAETV